MTCQMQHNHKFLNKIPVKVKNKNSMQRKKIIRMKMQNLKIFLCTFQMISRYDISK